jgi:hypothetical protein
MLTVCAARLEADRANPKLIEDLRAAAEELATARADGRGHTEADEKRIEHQRTLFAMLPSSNATDRLEEAMLQRAYDLMWDGDGLACDALAEFLPSDAVDRMFAAWDSDQADAGPPSKFYGGAA